MASTAAQDDLEVLTGSHAWSATPHDYSSMRFLTFKPDGRGEALYGYGQTIYAKVGFEFELSGGSALRLKYLPSPAFAAFRGFEPSPDTAEKLISYTLVRGEYRGVESIVAWPFVCKWLLTLADSPWPAGMTFPYTIPTSFFGYRRDESSKEPPSGLLPNPPVRRTGAAGLVSFVRKLLRHGPGR